MKKRKKKEAQVAEQPSQDEPATNPQLEVPDFASDLGAEGDTVVEAAPLDDSWEGPTRDVEIDQLTELAARSVEVTEAIIDPVSVEGVSVEGVSVEGVSVEGVSVPVDGVPIDTEAAEAPVEDAVETLAALDGAPGRLESVIESLLFASERPLALGDLKRLLSERDGAKINAALEALRARRADAGVQVVALAGGWHLRTHPDNAPWVSRFVAGRPQRLSRAMLETLAIVAYRQPITRPEIDEIRGVDCGPVLKTLLDRGLIRMIGKREEAGRPILYGTTPEFLRVFSLRDLTELPTLREFHELGAAEMEKVAKVDAETGGAATASPLPPPVVLRELDPEEDDELLSELERAASAAARATGPTEAPTAEPPPPEEPERAPAPTE